MKYLTKEERGWLEEAREEISLDAVGLCHDVPIMLGRLATAVEALEEAQGRFADGTGTCYCDTVGETPCAYCQIATLERQLAQVQAGNKRLKRERVKARTKIGMVAGSLTVSVHTLQEQLEEAQEKLKTLSKEILSAPPTARIRRMTAILEGK